MAGIETGITVLEDVFFNNNLFSGQNWILMLIIIIASMVLITRQWTDWGEIFLPVMIGWKYAGMSVPTIFMVLGGIIFVVSILSMKVIGGALGTVEDAWVNRKFRRSTSKRSYKPRKTSLEESFYKSLADKEELKKLAKEVASAKKIEYMSKFKSLKDAKMGITSNKQRRNLWAKYYEIE